MARRSRRRSATKRRPGASGSRTGTRPFWAHAWRPVSRWSSATPACRRRRTAPGARPVRYRRPPLAGRTDESHGEDGNPMVRGSDRYRVHDEEVAAKVIDGEAIIINLTTGVYYSLDPTGSEVWSLLEAGHDLDAIAGHLGGRYDVSASTG